MLFYGVCLVLVSLMTEDHFHHAFNRFHDKARKCQCTFYCLVASVIIDLRIVQYLEDDYLISLVEVSSLLNASFDQDRET